MLTSRSAVLHTSEKQPRADVTMLVSGVGIRRLSTRAKSVLIVGGAGALGQAVTKTFQDGAWQTVVADVKANPSAFKNVDLKGVAWKAQAPKIAAALHGLGIEKQALDAVVCVAGGFASEASFTLSLPVAAVACCLWRDCCAPAYAYPRFSFPEAAPLSAVSVFCPLRWHVFTLSVLRAVGSVLSEDVFDSIELMNDVCLKPAVVAAHIASQYLIPAPIKPSFGGVFVLTGSASVGKSPMYEALGYDLAKAATHRLALTISPKVCTQLILPYTIDTPANRCGKGEGRRSAVECVLLFYFMCCGLRVSPGSPCPLLTSPHGPSRKCWRRPSSTSAPNPKVRLAVVPRCVER